MSGRRALTSLASGALLVAFGGCSLLLDSDELARGEDPGFGGAPEGGLVEGADGPVGCDLSVPLKDSPACVEDSVGVFVSASGDDSALGTKAAPVASIARGLAIAAQRGLRRVYVCEGTYDAGIEIDTPIDVHGGLSCAWSSTGAKPKLTPPAGAIGVRVRNVGAPIVIADLEVRVAADGEPGASAIAAFVSESIDVTFRNVTLAAGDGTGGEDGSARSNHAAAPTPGGSPAFFSTSGGAGPSCSCVDGTSSQGGTGASSTGAGVSSGKATPPVGGDNAGRTASQCTNGGQGADGVAGVAEGPLAAGVLTAEGWSPVPASLGSAANGAPGQGGGGGGAKYNGDSGSPAGGGGCGGCGGAGGGFGQSGGSSFALLSFHSVIRVEGGELTTSVGGSGGGGGPGEDGQPGAAGGQGRSACKGGDGGSGAGGAGGGGGAGGHSVPVAFVGHLPTVSGAKLTPGVGGVGGAGGAGGESPGNAGTAGEAGPAGKAQASLAL